MPLILREMLPEDEGAVRLVAAQLAEEGFAFLPYEGEWNDILRQVRDEASGGELAPGRVAADFLLAEVGAEIIGRVSIRHELNRFLLEAGGHVGYAVAPGHRRRGHATEILRQSVERLRRLGVARILVTCDDDNVASQATIEKCGGVFEDIREVNRGRKRRYWIDSSTLPTSD